MWIFYCIEILTIFAIGCVYNFKKIQKNTIEYYSI